MKVYKFTVMVIDHEDLGSPVIKNMLEEGTGTDWINPHVMDFEIRDIGKWEDSNPLNFRKTRPEEFNRLFNNV